MDAQGQGPPRGGRPGGRGMATLVFLLGGFVFDRPLQLGTAQEKHSRFCWLFWIRSFSIVVRTIATANGLVKFKNRVTRQPRGLGRQNPLGKSEHVVFLLCR